MRCTVVRMRSRCSHVSSRLRSISGSISLTGGKSARCTDSSRLSGQVAPQLFGGERQDRREQAREPVGHHVHGRLRRAAFARASGERVKPVLRDVRIERAQIDRDERVDTSGRSCCSRTRRTRFRILPRDARAYRARMYRSTSSICVAVDGDRAPGRSRTGSTTR